MQPTIFQRLHLWLTDNGSEELSLMGTPDYSIDTAIRKIADTGATLCIKLQDGQIELNRGLIRAIRQKMYSLGITPPPIGGWSQNRTDPIADAEKSNGLIIEESADFWVSACEFEYKGNPESENYKRLARFVNRCLQIAPMKDYMLNKGAWGFCYLPNEPAGQYMDWSAVKASKGRGIPQCYPNQFPDAPRQWPYDAMQIACKDDGYFDLPRSYFHPLIGIYPSTITVSVGAYTRSLIDAKLRLGFTYGFGVYMGRHLTPIDWVTLKTATQPAGTIGGSVLAWH